MLESESAWVLGHKIRHLQTDDSYGLIEVISPPKIPGPPPHSHRSEREFFLILKGQLDVMIDGRWQTLGAGASLELPPNSVHTFINNSEQDVVWITGWRPKGFERFFRDFGVSVAEPGARERSVSPDMVRQVIECCQSYGMHVIP